MHRLASTLVCALVLGSGTLTAQAPRPFALGVGAGLTLLAGEDRDFYKDGLALLAAVEVPVPRAGIDLRFDIAFHSIPGENRFTAPPPGDSLQLGDFTIFSLTANARYFLSPAGPARAYVIAGFGLYRQEAEAILYGQAIEGSATDFGAAGGVGVSVRLGRLRGFVEGRIHNIFADGGSAAVYPVTAGVVF